MNSLMRNALYESWMREIRPSSLMSGVWKRSPVDETEPPRHTSTLTLQPIMPLDLPVKVRSWELTVYPRSYIRRWLGVTRPAKARM